MARRPLYQLSKRQKLRILNNSKSSVVTVENQITQSSSTAQFYSSASAQTEDQVIKIIEKLKKI
jgi:hypothetical protein